MSPNPTPDFERRVGLAIYWRQKIAYTKGNAARLLEERWTVTGDPEVKAALANGAKDFRRPVCSRLLTEAGDKAFVNRCPRCNRVLRTPKARQCFWCGVDWHNG
jgi:hypothetical protein